MEVKNIVTIKFTSTTKSLEKMAIAPIISQTLSKESIDYDNLFVHIKPYRLGKIKPVKSVKNFPVRRKKKA